MKLKKWHKEVFHYVVVFGALLFAWPILMDKFNDVIPTAIMAFLVFVGADQLAHKIILGEDFSLTKVK